MRLRAPKPLPYKYVDRLIDETYEFHTSVYGSEDDGLVLHTCSHRQREDLHNYDRLVFEVINEDHEYYASQEDEDGYHPWHGGGMEWIAEWTDEDTERVLDTEVYCDGVYPSDTPV